MEGYALVRVPTVEDHPWSNVAYDYVSELWKARFPFRALSYTAAPYLMVPESKWHLLAHVFDGPYDGDPKIHLVVGPGDMVEKYWTRAPITVAVTAARPTLKDTHLAALRDYDYVIAPNTTHQIELAAANVKAQAVPPTGIVEFLETLPGVR